MLDLLEEVDLLEDFTLAELVLHILLLDCLNCHTLTSQFVHAECDFAESSLANQLDEFVEFESRRWEFVILRNVILDVADEFITFFEKCIVDLELSVDSTALGST